MGIDYDSNLIYGYSFSYDELEELCEKNDFTIEEFIEKAEEFIEKAEDLNYQTTYFTSNGTRIHLSFDVDDCYCSEYDAEYFIGIKLKSDLILKDFCQYAAEVYIPLNQAIKDLFPKEPIKEEPRIINYIKIH